jgi:cellulose synthase/poly-beta-1,6-N-acetylglucosamine synthase-like glycosyltransferase
MQHIKLDGMTSGERSIYMFFMFVGVGLTIVFATWWFKPSHVPGNFGGWGHVVDYIAFALLSYVVWYQVCYELFSWYLTAFMKRAAHPPVPSAGMRVALLTAFVPSKEPYDVLEKTLQAMINVMYPHDTWVLDEGNDPETMRLCQKWGAKHYSRHGIAKYNTENGKFKARTKAGNYNSWFVQFASRYDIVGQHDVDFVPKKTFFSHTLGYFNDEEVAFVGTPQIYGNKKESWIARGAAEQAYGFYGPIQKGLYGHDMSLFIGANHIVRVAAHDDVEGYSGHIVEDHLTGMKFYAKRWKSVYVPEILAIGEGPATWDSYFSQQMRWAYGLIDILFKHSPKIFREMRFVHAANYFLLQQYYFYGIAQVIGITLITLYFISGFEATSMRLLPLVALYVPLIIWQFIIFFWLQRFNVNPKNESGLLWRGRLLSLAAWPVYFMAFVGVIRNKRLTYVVTPKGAGQIQHVPLSLFLPHFVLGLITLIGVIIGFATGHSAPQILFWGILNTFFMFYFVISISFRRVLSFFGKDLVKVFEHTPILKWFF